MTQTPLTYKVELDVSGSAFGTAFAATDVTAKAVAGLGFEPTTITWGRQDQYSDVNPTTVSGLLQNTDGTFTPGNTAGTYYPKIKRGLRRRVSVGVNAATVNLSEDYATSIEVKPASEGLATTAVEGADILARFGTSTPLRSFLAEEMLVDAPSCLYMLQEADGATSFGDVAGNNTPLALTNSKYGAGVVTAGQTLAATFQAGTFVNIANSTYGTATKGGSWLAGALPSLSSLTVEAWVQMPTTKPAAGTLGQIVYLTNQISVMQIAVDENGFLQFGAATSAPAGGWCDGKLHHFVGTVSAGTATLYVDGVSAATAAYTPPTNLTTLNIGMRDQNTGGVYPFSGEVAYVALYPTALSAARAAAHYSAGVTAFAGERTDQRVARLLTYRANTGSSLDTGLGTMGLQDIAGRTLQDCLFEVGQTEGGVVFADGTGRTNFRSRSRLFNPAPTVTLDMKAGGVDFGSNWREDTQNVINDATVTNTTTGSEQRNFSASSIAADGEFATSLTLPLNADTDAANRAGWIVANGTQANLTATPLIINLLHLTAAQARAVLQLKPLDCVRLTNCPTPAPSATQTFIVEGGSTSIAADAASVTLNVTPLPYPVGVWDSTTWDAAGVTWAF